MNDRQVAICRACGMPFKALIDLGGGMATCKCAACLDGSSENIQDLDKKVLYLDQMAISEIFKIRTGTMDKDAPHYSFWKEASELLERCVFLQQLVCPQSDIHLDETIVFQRGKEMGIVHEMLGGHTSFKSTTEIEGDQVWAHLQAFRSRSAPEIDFDVDDILHGLRNEWLPPLHLTVSMNWPGRSELVRDHREQSADDLIPLYERWRSEPRTSFWSVLNEELECFGDQRVEAYVHFRDLARRGYEKGDHMSFMDGVNSPVMREFRECRDLFMKDGLGREDAELKVVEFWRWKGNISIPHHRIQSYLFAAMARKIVAGQKKNPTRGAMNDVRAIATYAPYVHAMFVDNEFAAFLGENPLKKDLNYRAHIFSLRSKEAFLEYLRGLIRGTPIEINIIAEARYKVGA